MSIARLKRRTRDLLVNTYSTARSRTTSRDTFLALSEYMRRVGRDLPSALDSPVLTGFELKIFSQNGEDGVIAECLRRVGKGPGWFVEFGAGAGVEGSCVVLADVRAWSGLFIESDPVAFKRLERKYTPNPRVQTRHAAVTESNVEDLFAAAGVPDEPDVVSIDIDGADYWVWTAMRRFRPRVIVIEYNSSCPPGEQLAQPRDRTDGWDRTDFFGASIEALRRLGETKGYRLVHTELTGTNAFFVRSDLPGPWPEPADVPLRGVNQFLLGVAHDPDPHGRSYVIPETE